MRRSLKGKVQDTAVFDVHWPALVHSGCKAVLARWLLASGLTRLAVKQYDFWQQKRKGDNIDEEGAHLNISEAARQLLAMFTVNAAAGVDADNRNTLVHVGSVAAASLSRSQRVTHSTNLFLLEQNQKPPFTS